MVPTPTAAAYPSAHAASPSSIVVAGAALTGPSALTTRWPSTSAARTDGTVVPGEAPKTVTGSPVPGSTASRPSPWNPLSGAGLPGR